MHIVFSNRILKSTFVLYMPIVLIQQNQWSNEWRFTVCYDELPTCHEIVVGIVEVETGDIVFTHGWAHICDIENHSLECRKHGRKVIDITACWILQMSYIFSTAFCVINIPYKINQMGKMWICGLASNRTLLRIRLIWLRNVYSNEMLSLYFFRLTFQQ